MLWLILLALLIIIPMLYPRMKTWVVDRVIERVQVRSEPSEFELAHNHKYGTVTYSRSGNAFKLRVPMDRKLLRRPGIRVVHILDDVTSDITQQPGIPYLITAEQLGGGEIVVLQDEEELARFRGAERVVIS